MSPFHKKLDNIELSTTKLLPGVVKIFGDYVSQGSNYKCVRVDHSSTAQQVVRIALQRFNLEHLDPKDYVICDVIGKLSSPIVDGTEAETPVSDGDRDVSTDTPENTDVVYPVASENMISESSGAISETASDCGSVESSETQKKMRKKPSTVSLKKKMSSISNSFRVRRGFISQRNKNSLKAESDSTWTTEYIRSINPLEKPLILQSLWKPEKGKSRRFELRHRDELRNFIFFLNNPTYDEPDVLLPRSVIDELRCRMRTEESKYDIPSDPYLVQLKGFSDDDMLVHTLRKPMSVIGPHTEGECEDTCDILLHCPHLALPYCWLYKKLTVGGDHGVVSYTTHIEPADGTHVEVNGTRVQQKYQLRAGDVITFEDDYVFLYKDPSSVSERDLKFCWLEKMKNKSNDDITDEHMEDILTGAIGVKKETKDKFVQAGLSKIPENLR